MRDPFEVLAVAPGAAEDDIRTAYRALAQIYHPDRFLTASAEVQRQSHERMTEVTAAFELLRANGWRRVPADPGDVAADGGIDDWFPSDSGVGEATDWSWLDDLPFEEPPLEPLGTSADHWLDLPADGSWFEGLGETGPDRLEPFGSWAAQPEWMVPFIADWLEDPSLETNAILIGSVQDGLIPRLSLVNWVKHGSAPPGPTWMLLLQREQDDADQLIIGVWGLPDPTFASDRCQQRGLSTWPSPVGHFGTAVLLNVPPQRDRWREAAEAARLIACVVGTVMTHGVEATLVVHDPTSADVTATA